MTNFVYVCESIKDSNVMCNDNKKALGASDILYVNKLTNVVYQDGEILETTYRKAKKDTLTEAIFDVFARMLTRSGDERKVLYHLIFDKAEYTKNSLSKHLSAIYFKSETDAVFKSTPTELTQSSTTPPRASSRRFWGISC